MFHSCFYILASTGSFQTHFCLIHSCSCLSFFWFLLSLPLHLSNHVHGMKASEKTIPAFTFVPLYSLQLLHHCQTPRPGDYQHQQQICPHCCLTTFPHHQHHQGHRHQLAS